MIKATLLECMTLPPFENRGLTHIYLWTVSWGYSKCSFSKIFHHGRIFNRLVAAFLRLKCDITYKKYYFKNEVCIITTLIELSSCLA